MPGRVDGGMEETGAEGGPINKFQRTEGRTKVVREGDGRGEVLEEPIWEHLKFSKEATEVSHYP